ncbi:MAG TPA: mannose-1-phosphate guanylyltransferase [Bacteroidota bacterium]|nr:mannose-1-phosphate guanylyltransferase [Bacteroidota bacterium]
MANLYAVIMAGGVGSRFWPRSRERTPKQLLEIVGTGTMIQNTVARIESLVPPERVLVVTNQLQHEMVTRQLSTVPRQNILVEPIGRNTAPCIGLAASWIKKADPNAVMIVLPADHIIRDSEEFQRILKIAVRVAEETNGLITIGIKPTHPETGYGYIQIDEEHSDRNPYSGEGVYRVKTFAEKPTLETAEQFLKSGDFLWNSGMFVWKASVILQEIEHLLPDLYEQIQNVAKSLGNSGYQEALEKSYGLIRSISIDYGVMEKANDVFVIKGDFGWSDVGSWDEVVRLSTRDDDGNTLKGKVIIKDAVRNYIDAGNRLVAAVGVEDLIIVATEDAILVCKKGKSQDVKEIVDYVRRKQMNEYL